MGFNLCVWSPTLPYVLLNNFKLSQMDVNWMKEINSILFHSGHMNYEQLSILKKISSLS